MERIGVWGAGSLGLLLAGKLAASGCEVRLYTRTKEQAERVNETGVSVEETDGTKVRARAGIEAVSFEKAESGADYPILLTVKQTALTAELFVALKRVVAPGGVLVLFQNGIGHAEKLRKALPNVRLGVAVTTEGALRSGPAAVLHTGRGETRIGPAPALGESEIEPLENGKEGETFDFAAKMLKRAGFSVFLSNELGEALLRKLLINSVVNPLTALLRIRNGELPSTPERAALMDALFEESYGILSAYGLNGKDELREAVRRVCQATAGNRSSMLQDALAGKPTEIDAINGALVRMAAAKGVAAPWNEAVTALVRALLPLSPP